jgi:hypothetical protein
MEVVPVSKSTGPILAIGGITLANNVLMNGEPFDWRIPVATGITAGMFALLERAFPQAAVGLAWLALVTLLFTRTKPNVPAPVETLQILWKKGP